LFVSVEIFFESSFTQKCVMYRVGFQELIFILVAGEMRVSEPLVSNGRFVLLKYSGFQPSCHNTVSENAIKIQHDMAKLFVIPNIAYSAKNMSVQMLSGDSYVLVSNKESRSRVQWPEFP
jgi:hypothetical protein